MAKEEWHKRQQIWYATQVKKMIQTQAIENNEQHKHTENRQRLLILPVGRPTNKTRNLGSSKIQRSELLP